MNCVYFSQNGRKLRFRRRRAVDSVTRAPILLGKKFKRHADKVILRKNGVTK